MKRAARQQQPLDPGLVAVVRALARMAEREDYAREVGEAPATVEKPATAAPLPGYNPRP